MSHTFKNGSHLKKWITPSQVEIWVKPKKKGSHFPNMGVTLKKTGSCSEKLVTFQTNGPHLEK